MLPEVPNIKDELVSRCAEKGDFAPVLFEWYKYTGALANFFARTRQESPCLRKIDAQHWQVLIGFLNRCSRLMLANIRLSSGGLFGETTGIIDRCIFETCVKLRWLCAKRDDESFRRLILDGLKSDLQLKKIIEENVAANQGNALPIEARMLLSIQSALQSANATETDVETCQKLPDLASMIAAYGGNRLEYVVGQRMGSHHVHGTWVSLERDYLEDSDGVLGPKDHESSTDQNQYLFGILTVLESLDGFVEYVLEGSPESVVFKDLIEAVRDEVLEYRGDLGS